VCVCVCVCVCVEFLLEINLKILLRKKQEQA
jgi:hypothetical protein